jgi:hypothetical protein
LIRCSTASACQRAIDLLASHGLRWLVLGAGSRIVAPDRGLRIPLLHLAGELQRSIVGEDGGLVIGAGAKVAQVGGSLARSGPAELDRLVGAPGSAGGDLRAAALGEPSVVIDLAEWIEVARPGAGPTRVGPADSGTAWTAGLGEGRAVITRVRLRSGQPSQPFRNLRVAAWRWSGRCAAGGSGRVRSPACGDARARVVKAALRGVGRRLAPMPSHHGGSPGARRRAVPMMHRVAERCGGWPAGQISTRERRSSPSCARLFAVLGGAQRRGERWLIPAARPTHQPPGGREPLVGRSGQVIIPYGHEHTTVRRLPCVA